MLFDFSIVQVKSMIVIRIQNGNDLMERQVIEYGKGVLAIGITSHGIQDEKQEYLRPNYNLCMSWSSSAKTKVSDKNHFHWNQFFNWNSKNLLRWWMVQQR